MKATVNSAVSIIRAALIAAATAALLPSFSAAAADGAGQAPQKRPWSIYKKYTVYCTVNDYTSCYIYTD